MLKIVVFLLFLITSNLSYATDECVILLHGLARTERSMNTLQNTLSQEGYHVVNHGYPSREYPVEELSSKFFPSSLEKCSNKNKIHFVTHSMGGIILRHYLINNEINELHRVVMLGPPNKGSEVVDNLSDVPGFKFMNGPAGMQLGTIQYGGLPSTLGPAKGEVGIIAGSKSINLLLSLYLPNPDDGKVSVENTKLEGMKDHLVVDVSHPFLMKNQEVIEQVIHFLKNGNFIHN